MGVFHVFKIVQMVPNRTKHHKFVDISGKKRVITNVLTVIIVSLFFFFFPLVMIQVFVVIAKTGLYFLLKIFEK